MARRACFVRHDLSEVRLYTGASADGLWRGGEPAPVGATAPESPEPRDALWWKNQAALAGAWLASRLGPSGSLDTVCIDVAETACVWVKSPGHDRRVLAATLQQHGEEWATLESGGLLEPLVDPGARVGGAGDSSRLWEMSVFGLGRKKAPAGAPTSDGLAALVAPDALIRLFLDELDRRGVHVRRVVTLWHAACEAFLGDRAETAATVMVEPTRIVWCWGRQGRLQAGGLQRIVRTTEPRSDAGSEASPGSPPAPESAPADLESARARLSLDWLSWSMQLGDSPRSVVVIGPGAGALSEAVGRGWPDAVSVPVDAPDPIDAAMLAISAASRPGADADDPRASLPSLSRRRGKAHQRLYTWTGATLALFSLAIGAWGWRLQGRRTALLAAADSLRARQASTLLEVAPDLKSSANAARALESRLTELRQKKPDFADPPRAKPILDEVERLVNSMAELGGRGLRVSEIVIHDIAPTAHVVAPDFQVGEEFTSRLKSSGAVIRWRVEYEGGADDGRRYRVVGEWPKEAS